MTTATRGIISRAEWRSSTGRIIGLAIFLTMIVASVLVIFPFLFTLTAGLKTTTEIATPQAFLPAIPNWHNYVEAWDRLNMFGMFKNSFIVAIGAVIGRLLVSALAAY